MKNLRWVTVCLLALGLLAGCGSTGPTRKLDDPGNSLVFGYADMSEAPTDIAHASLFQGSPQTDNPYLRLGANKGLFSSGVIPMGSYQLISFFGKGSSFLAADNVYSLPAQNNPNILRIVKPDIYFLGSFKYKKVSTGFFENGKFSLEKTSSPTEAILLQRLLDEDCCIKNSPWKEKILARLAQFK
jgi:hypothetical protein